MAMNWTIKNNGPQELEWKTGVRVVRAIGGVNDFKSGVGTFYTRATANAPQSTLNKLFSWNSV